MCRPSAHVPAVGRSVPRREGADKVTGQARYTDDLVVGGAWYGRTIRSTIARGTIRSIVLAPAFDWSRVVVVTADDIPGENVVHLIRDDQPVLARPEEGEGTEIRHREEPILLLADAPLSLSAPEEPPDLEVDGTGLWRLVPDVPGGLGDAQLLIADGHHRYESAAELGQQQGEVLGVVGTGGGVGVAAGGGVFPVDIDAVEGVGGGEACAAVRSGEAVVAYCWATTSAVSIMLM